MYFIWIEFPTVKRESEAALPRPSSSMTNWNLFYLTRSGLHAGRSRFSNLKKKTVAGFPTRFRYWSRVSDISKTSKYIA